MTRTATIEFWGVPRSLPIDPTDRQVQHTFTSGQCTSFARALHRETGWPLVVMCYGDDFDYGDDVGIDDVVDYASNDGDHVVCRRPDGWLVDIYGAWPPGTRWEGLPALVELTDREVGRLGWDRQNPRKARPFAKALLRILDSDPEYGLPA